MTLFKWHNDSNSMHVYLNIILKKHNVLSFQLDNGLEVSFTDKRRLARVRLLEDVSDPFLVIVTIYSCLESLLHHAEAFYGLYVYDLELMPKHCLVIE